MIEADKHEKSILQQIIQHKKEEIQIRRTRKPLDQLRQDIKHAPPVRSFIQALENTISSNLPAIIAELKKASPSRGVICTNFDPTTIAVEYAQHGASCLSILTDEKYFCGNLCYIKAVREVCMLPILCKDFFIDPYQVFEARMAGADCILLIVAAVDDSCLETLTQLAHQLDMEVLVEVHNKEELVRALRLPVRLIGINNRDLKTFDTSLETTISLKSSVPDDRLLVSESGIHSCAEIQMLREHGVQAFLIGEVLMKSKQPGQALKELMSLPST